MQLTNFIAEAALDKISELKGKAYADEFMNNAVAEHSQKYPEASMAYAFEQSFAQMFSMLTQRFAGEPFSPDELYAAMAEQYDQLKKAFSGLENMPTMEDTSFTLDEASGAVRMAWPSMEAFIYSLNKISG